MENIYKDLKKQLKTKGINIINTDYYNYIQIWKEWFTGFVDGFHNYNVKLADGNVSEKERLTMNMPKKVCEDRTKLVWTENVKISLDNDDKTKELWKILDSKTNNFSIMFPKVLEQAYALGTIALSEFTDENGNVIIEYIGDAMNIVPYEYDNFNVTGLCVLDQYTEEEKGKAVYYTHVTYHEFKGNKYTKLNELYKSKSENELGREVSFEEEFPNVEEYTEYENVERPYFQLFRPNVANNFDMETPMGISVFANSIDRFKAIDTKYDSFTNEFLQGKKRIVVDKSALKGTPVVDENGNISTVVYFDKNDDTFVAVNGMQDQPLKEIDFSLRVQEHITSLNSELSWLGANVGLGESYYSTEGSRVKTATEVISEDSEAYRTMKSDSIVLKDVVYDIVASVCELAGIEYETINIELDQERFVDKKEELARLQYELANGLITKEEYLMKVYGIDKEDASARIKEVNKSNPSVKDLIGETKEDKIEE